MSPVVANFLFEVGNFLLLVVGLGWVLFRPVRRVLDEERARHERETGEAARLRAEAEALAAKAHESGARADRAAERQARELVASAREEAARLLAEARAAGLAERRALDRELGATRAASATAAADAVGRVAAGAVERLLVAAGGPDLDTALLRAASAELGRLGAGRGGPVVVESARPLAPEALRLLGAALGEGVEQRVVAALGAGVRVTTPGGQVDATAVGFGREAARAVVAELAGSAPTASEPHEAPGEAPPVIPVAKAPRAPVPEARDG